MKAIPNEIRMKIIKHKNNGETEKNIAKWLFISKSSVTKIWGKFQSTGNIFPDPRPGRKPKVTEEEMDKAIAKQAEKPDITINDLIAECELDITESGMSKKLKKRGITFKKR
jgi:transposase